MADYNVLVKMQLVAPDMQAQINKLAKNTTINIKAKIADSDKLNIQADTLINRLNRLKIANTDAFKNPEIVAQHQNMLQLAESVRKGEISYQKAGVQVGKFSNDLLKANEAFRTTIKSSDNFITTLTKDMGKVLLWGVATGIVYGSLKKIGDGIQYISDLDKELTNVRLVTGATELQTRKLAQEYNDLAKELSVTTLEVAKESLEWQRQGKTAEETEQLLRASVMMGTIANLDQAQSTEYLTSIINGYKLSLDEVMPTVSKLVALDNNYASSVGRQNCRNTWEHVDNIIF